MAEKLLVRQIRGVAGRDKIVRRRLQALGLGRVGNEKVLPSNPAVLGALEKVAYLVSVQQQPGQ
jgi:ribosomal protein L30